MVLQYGIEEVLEFVKIMFNYKIKLKDKFIFDLNYNLKQILKL